MGDGAHKFYSLHAAVRSVREGVGIEQREASNALRHRGNAGIALQITNRRVTVLACVELRSEQPRIAHVPR